MHKVEISDEMIRRVHARRGKFHLYERMEGARTALIVVDLQNAFMLPGMPSEIPAARDIVPNVNRLAEAVRAAGGKVAWVQMTLSDQDRTTWSTYFDGLSEERGNAMVHHLTVGAYGHAIYEGLDAAPGDLRVVKSRFSALQPHSSNLHEILSSGGIDTVLVAGTLTNTCCESTARDAMALNYRTIMVADANATRSDEEHNATLRSFILGFGDVYFTDEIIDLLKGQKGA